MMDIERRIDGLVGRMLSWLVQAPLRSTAGVAKGTGVEAKAEPIEQAPAATEQEAPPVAMKQAAAKRTTARQATAKKSAAKQTTSKRTTVKKTTAKQATAKRATAKKASARPAAKVSASRKSGAKQVTAKKTTARKPAARPAAKRTPRQEAGKKTAVRAKSLDTFVDAAEQVAEAVTGTVTEAADEHLDRFVESAEPVSSQDDDLKQSVLATLAASGQGASLAELHSKVGGKLANLRRQLNQLQETGRVQRGKGIGTRYHLT